MTDPQGQSAYDADPQGQSAGEGEQLITLANGQQVTPETAVKMIKDAQSEIGRLKANKGAPAQDGDNQLGDLEAFAKALAPILKKEGLAGKDDVQSITKERTFEKFLAANPAMQGKRDLLTTLSNTHPEMSYEDIVAKYSLGETSKNQPSGDVVGEDARERFRKDGGQKAMSDITNVNTAEDLTKFEEEHGIGKQNRFVKQRSV